MKKRFYCQEKHPNIGRMVISALFLIVAAQALAADGSTSPAKDPQITDTGNDNQGNSTQKVSPGADGNAYTLGIVKVEADAIPDDENSDVYNPNYSGKNTFYKKSNSTTATKTDTPIFDTPVSIVSVPRAVMDDQKSTRLKDALENISGVRTQPTLGMGTGFIVRGFRSNHVYRNGLVLDMDGFSSEYDTGNLHSIDVLKGPASVLFGRVEPGGLVNMGIKKPMDVPFYSLEQQFGSYDYYRTQWDATGPITKDGSLSYRFTGAYQNANSFRDFIFTDRVMADVSITWKPTERTDFTFNVEGFDQDYFADFGVPAISNILTKKGKPAPIPISRTLDDPSSPNDFQSRAIIYTELNHRFNDDWAIHNRFHSVFTQGFSSFTGVVNAFTNDPSDPTYALRPNGDLRRNIFEQFDNGALYSTNLDLTGKFDWEFSHHETLVGFDYTNGSQNYGSNGFYTVANPDLTINIYRPTYGIDPQLVKKSLDSTDPNFTDNRAVFEQEWYGAYFQDHITLWDKLHIMGGGRYDWAYSGNYYSTSFDVSEQNLKLVKAEGFSPRVGILYQPVKELGIFGNWATSFNANNGQMSDGSIPDPQTGEQFEAGLKTQLFDDRLLATVAYYYLTKDNILVADLSTPSPFDYKSNQQRSQGIELDVSGQFTDQLSLIGSYAFTDASVLKDFSGDTEGNRLPNVPEHSGSLWLKYDMKGFDAKDGFSFGVGGVAASSRQGDFANSFQMPGYVRMDAFAAYKTKVAGAKITTQFNIRNILDHDYYESTDPFYNIAPSLGIAPGAPLTAIGSIRVEY